MKPTGKRKEKADFVAIAEMLNMLRLEVGSKVMTSKEIIRELKSILPASPTSLGDFTKVGIVTRVKRDNYVFPKDPICWTLIADYYNKLRKRNRKYEAKRVDKRKAIKIKSNMTEMPTASAEGHLTAPVESPTRELTIDDEQRALSLLKRLGYIVLKMM